MLFPKKNKNSQSWNERFGFFYFQFCSSYIENYVTSLSRQNLDDIELLQGLPIAHERMDAYLDKFSQRSLKVSSVIRQCLTGFQQDAPHHMSWNELAYKSKDLIHILDVKIRMETYAGTQGFESSASKVSMTLLGITCALINENISELTLKSSQDKLEIILDNDNTQSADKSDLSKYIDNILAFKLPSDKGSFGEAFKGICSEANLQVEFTSNKVAISSKVS